MFEKLLAVMPYNPGLAHQMAFYSRRMREEASIRRIGLIFLVLAFMVQFFAVMSPPQPTVADSSNDLVNGGISSAADAAQKCRDNVRHYGDVLEYYGVSCSDVRNGDTISLRSTAHDGTLFSFGWHSYGPRNPSSGKKTYEQPVNLPGVSRNVYMRHLDSFDTGPYSTYQALAIRNSEGKRFYILFSCGNLVSIGIPTPVAKPTPKPTPAPAPAPTPAPTPVTPATPVVHTTPKCAYNASLPADSPLCFKPCAYDSSIPADSSSCKPCDKSVGSTDAVACIVVHKAASNVTAGLTDANNTTANGGDVLNYTLSAQNSGKAAVKDFVFTEDLSDVLDYADATDLHGGTIDSNNLVSWPAQTLAAGTTATHQITVKVKDPVPQTPVSASDPAHFDLIMTNVYGDTVNIHLPGSPVKTVETTTAALPNTGPGTTLFLAALTVILGGFFYSRSRLLAKESSLAVQGTAGA
jgi:uncharacterized repeat protein (TIGR01451 family)